MMLKRHGLYENPFRIEAGSLSFFRSPIAREVSRKQVGHFNGTPKRPKISPNSPFAMIAKSLSFNSLSTSSIIVFNFSFLDKLEAFPVNSVTYVWNDVENCVQFTHFGAEQNI